MKFTIKMGKNRSTQERIEILSKVKTGELLNLAALLRRKHKEWSQLPVRPREKNPDPIRRHFNMLHWFEGISIECGFSGCAIGTLCTFDKEAAKRLGLSLECTVYGQYYPKRGSQVDYESVESAFGLPKASEFDVRGCSFYYFPVTYLFSPQAYTSDEARDPLYVADRIQGYAELVEKTFAELTASS